MAHPGGRPTKYTKEMVGKVDEYIKHELENKLLPTMYGLALWIDVNRDTLLEWGKQHVEFSGSLTKLNDLQANQLVQKGLDNSYNSTIAKLILSANHGMRERTDVTTNEKDLPTPIYGGDNKGNF